ncbi:EF-hand pair protein (macronuclear) [Tetrahymena thermophila SB210]|uniref:EF-hand pair protein n=1 Tax=Tetrahymena thermophila (strain SB210) TaxID=312017 RepID=Q24I95_TETTS|nr:EF-hand pair protein [Tetrahymena thermophila SB210]EAS07502.1 EF-hand pair protein [Tetrahymena thermophila SB210]|eukprot:XP_001027744.1 EF-hand pair protein [Tetrahymena thermophila SB210]
MQAADQHVTEVLQKLKLAMKHYNISTIDGYFKMDKDNNFVVSVSEFGETLKQVDPTLTAYEIQLAFDRFDTNKSGTLDYSEFSSNMDKIQIPDTKTYTTKEQLQESQQNVSKAELEKLQNDQAALQTAADRAISKLKQAVAYYNINLYDLFRKYDSTRDGVLDINEFARLILQMEPNLEITDILAAFGKFDSDQNYTISISEFQDAIKN